MPKMVDTKDEVEVKKVKKKEVTDSDLTYFEIKGLPSKGKLYPEGTIFEGRSLNIIEVKRLASMTDENAEHTINDILRRTTRGIEIEDILVSDKLFIVFWLRANTYREPGYSVDFKCTECDQESSYDFDLSCLGVEYLSDDFTPEKTQVTLKNGDIIDFHMPTLKDERLKNKFKITYSKVIKEVDEDFLGLSIMIDKINDENVDLLNKYNYLTNIKPPDFAYLSTKLNEFDCGINDILNVTCKKCGGNAQVGVSFCPEFFLPKYTA